MKKNILAIASLELLMPFMAMAATVTGIIDKIKDLLKLIVPILVIIAVAVFFWGVIMFIGLAGSEDKRKESKNYIIYGLIGMFVIVAMWGIIQIILNTFFGGQPGSPGSIPTIPGLN